ncbi:TetR/AcrR family transcriptional regulator [Aquimarina sp. MMG016]|uniref:TetR/AcrR family transcriptional regulator n=1 Tax=Aquimarina sp. MMG016 TaxID=2822690 RepID=UPI001B3A08A8|nr:TetR/AcrR family transcriptional regulator [Aquimarina sp. MMG016]MBQ4821107.1 TetR/AcrR family transcriptional regulator [Aquimarina sp. MMG016]
MFVWNFRIMPKLKDQNKVEAIHKATIELITKTGFSGLKMAEVAKKSGVATGTLYVYYKSKEELINDVYVNTKKEISRAIINPEYLKDTFYDTFKAMWYGYFGYCLKHPEKMMFVEQFIYSGFISEVNISVTESYFEALNQFLIDGQKQGVIKDVDMEILKAYLQGSIHEIVKMVVKGAIELQKNDMHTCFTMAWNSIRK